MIEVEVNGVIHEFPEGTSKDVIRSALQRKYAPQPKVTSLPEQAVNLGLAYAQGRSMGIVTKPMSAIGATMAYPFVAAGKAIQGEEIPSWADLYKIPVEDIGNRIKQSREDSPWLTVIAEIAGGLKSGGEIAKSKAGQAFTSGAKNFIATKGTGAASKTGMLAKGALVGGLVGEASQRAYEAGTSPVGEEAGILFSPSPSVGGMLGAASPVLSAGVSSAVKGITPKLEGPTKAAAAQLYSLAKKHGIDLEVSDIAGSGRYKRIVAQGKMLPFSGAEEAAEKTQTQINKAVSKTLGEEVEKITPEYLDGVRKTLGTKFESFTKGKEFSVTADAYNKLDEMANIASRKGYGAEGEALFNQYKKELESLVDERGLIKGDKLDKFRRDLSEVSRRQANSDIGQVASDFEDAVVDIISDSDPAISKAISDAKYKYKNYKVVLNPAARNQATGDISPASLSGAVQRVYGVDKFATGRAGDLGEIARVGQSLRKPSSSGTAENIMTQRGILENIVRTPQYIGNAMLQAYNRNPKNVESILRQPQNLSMLTSNSSILRTPVKTSIGSGMLSGYLGE